MAAAATPVLANTPAQFPQAGLDQLAKMDRQLNAAMHRLGVDQPDLSRGDIRVLDEIAKKVAHEKHGLLDDQFNGQTVLCQPVEAAYRLLEKADLAFERATKVSADDALGALAVARHALIVLSSGIALAPDRNPACDRAAADAADAALGKVEKEIAKVSDKVEEVIKKHGKNASMTQQEGLQKEIRGLGKDKRGVISQHMREETYCQRFDALYSNLYLLDKLLGEARGELGQKNPEFDYVRNRFKGARAVKEYIEQQLKKPCPETGTTAGCTSTLERSPGTAPYTANNHIRVRATCDQTITKVEVALITMNSFDACAQTKGSGSGCTASGQLLTANWNQPANSELEFYGRVTGNAAGMYHVKIYGTYGAVLKEYDATVP
jgi:hypothetical protein